MIDRRMLLVQTVVAALTGVPVGSRAAASASPAPRAYVVLPSLAPLVDAVKGAVVNVEVTGRAGVEADGDGDADEGGEGADRPGVGPRDRDREGSPRDRGGDRGGPLMRGAGSGFVIDARGLVVTNDHVVKDATSIRVRLEDGRVFDAVVAGRDPLTDVAVMRLKGDVGRLPVVALGDSDALRVGDWVVAIGNPFGLASSVSAGIISGKARNIGAGPYDDFLQTDAAINPGNSGGPVFDVSGRVVGMSTAIVGGGTGIGFAVPSSTLRVLVPELERGRRVSRGFLGATIQDLTPELARALGAQARRGAVIADVRPGGPGARAGLRPDDVVTGVNGKVVDSANALSRSVAFQAPGTVVTLEVQRRGAPERLRVELGERPEALEGTGAGGAGPEQRRAHERLGLVFEDVDPETATQEGVPARGAMITGVRQGSPADEAGLRPGMVVVEAGGHPVADAAQLARVLEGTRAGAVVLLRVQTRDGRLLAAVTTP